MYKAPLLADAHHSFDRSLLLFCLTRSSPATRAGHPKETESFFMKVSFAGTNFYSEERIGFYGKEDYCKFIRYYKTRDVHQFRNASGLRCVRPVGIGVWEGLGQFLSWWNVLEVCHPPQRLVIQGYPALFREEVHLIRELEGFPQGLQLSAVHSLWPHANLPSS